jgi:hypothetical protein
MDLHVTIRKRNKSAGTILRALCYEEEEEEEEEAEILSLAECSCLRHRIQLQSSCLKM